MISNRFLLPSFVSLSVSQSSASNSSVTAIGATKFSFRSMFLLFDTKVETAFGDDLQFRSFRDLGDLFFDLSLFTAILDSSFTRTSLSIRFLSDKLGEWDGELPDDLRSKNNFSLFSTKHFLSKNYIYIYKT